MFLKKLAHIRIYPSFDGKTDKNTGPRILFFPLTVLTVKHKPVIKHQIMRHVAKQTDYKKHHLLHFKPS